MKLEIEFYNLRKNEYCVKLTPYDKAGNPTRHMLGYCKREKWGLNFNEKDTESIKLYGYMLGFCDSRFYNDGLEFGFDSIEMRNKLESIEGTKEKAIFTFESGKDVSCRL